MARSITAAVQQLKAQLHAHLTPAEIHAACQAAGYDWRQRVLGPGKSGTAAYFGKSGTATYCRLSRCCACRPVAKCRLRNDTHTVPKLPHRCQPSRNRTPWAAGAPRPSRPARLKHLDQNPQRRSLRPTADGSRPSSWCIAPCRAVRPPMPAPLPAESWRLKAENRRLFCAFLRLISADHDNPTARTCPAPIRQASFQHGKSVRPSSLPRFVPPCLPPSPRTAA